MLRIAVATWCIVLSAVAAAAQSLAGPLVEVEWLKSNLARTGMVVLDARSGGGKTRVDFAAGHIPGAIFTDYAKDGWREKNAAGIDGMLPPPDKLEKLVGSLGISNDSHVIVVPEGRAAVDMAAATRIYWTFKVMGHDAVSILNGGYAAWVRPVDKDKKPLHPIEIGDRKPEAKAFKASLRKEMIIAKADVERAMAEKVPLVDHRPPDFYLGLSKSPAAKRSGTLPAASNVPEAWLTESNGGRLRSADHLRQLFGVAGVPVSGRQVNFCNTGHWASLGWFASHEILGNSQAVMYDGSMAEWTQDAKAPVDVKIQLK